MLISVRNTHWRNVMDANRTRIKEMSIARTMAALEKNNMDAAYLPLASDVAPTLKTLLMKNDKVAVGGSMTLFEAGVMELLRNGDYRFIDRYAPGLDAQQIRRIYLDSFDTDVYLTSANAITEHGELYCVDGNGNRVAAMIYGPKKVVVIAGWQKIVPDLAAAVVREKMVAGPANAVRLDCDTYCEKNGRCMSPVCDSRNLMALPAGACEHSICCDSVVFSRQRQKGRILVLIVGEELGY
jgi:hypothetical protein